MTKRRRRKCLNCGQVFRPDPRSVRNQRYCSTPACRKASKAASQARWLSKPHNRNYFRGPEHVARVRAWRVVVSRFVSWDHREYLSEYSVDGLPEMTEQFGSRPEPAGLPFA